MMDLLATIQSAAGNDGEHGALISGLFVIFLTVTAIIYLLVLVFLIWAIARRRLGRDEAAREGKSREGALRSVLAGWVALTALILGGLTIATWIYDRALARADGTAPLEIEIVANQWWWDVRYMDADSSKIVRDANELHLPAGVPTRITLISNDVIHSFWVPNLAGKQDMIPGRLNDINLRPLREGVFRAQCAEFCGMQHAKMAMPVIVESPAAFAAWRARALLPASPPPNVLTAAGQAYVTGAQCASCHAIAGTPASGQVAPDLTHFASRRTIAAGALPMSRANIARWIENPQAVKPGSNMPKVPLDAEQLRAVTFYLDSLK
jgi:cytochrome c oxidase subunit 2